VSSDRGDGAATTPSKALRQNIARLAGPDGVVIGVAIDHRDNFRAVLQRGGRDEPDMAGLKERIVRALVPSATALMLDHELGGAAIEHGAVPADVALIMPLEEQGYEQLGDDRTTSLMPEFSPTQAAELGATACKVLLPYRPDRRQAAEQQLQLAATAIAVAHGAGLPLVLEPTVHRLEAESEDTWRATYTELLLRATQETAALRPDVLKLPHPVLVTEPSSPGGADVEACIRLDTATDGIPWVLLGAGVSAEVFARQIESAGTAGASGFLAGRSIWADAAIASERDRPAAIETAISRLGDFANIAHASASSLHRRLDALAA
jgi:tagatose 1,6-diphosphate aldolase